MGLPDAGDGKDEKQGTEGYPKEAIAGCAELPRETEGPRARSLLGESSFIKALFRMSPCFARLTFHAAPSGRTQNLRALELADMYEVIETDRRNQQIKLDEEGLTKITIATLPQIFRSYKDNATARGSSGSFTSTRESRSSLSSPLSHFSELSRKRTVILESTMNLQSEITIRIDGIGGKKIPARLPLLPPDWVDKCMDLNIDSSFDQVLKRLTDQDKVLKDLSDQLRTLQEREKRSGGPLL